MICRIYRFAPITTALAAPPGAGPAEAGLWLKTGYETRISPSFEPTPFWTSIILKDISTAYDGSRRKFALYEHLRLLDDNISDGLRNK